MSTLSTYHIRANVIRWILLCQVAIILPHMLRIPIWISIISILTGMWGASIISGRTKSPPKLVLFLLVIAACSAMFLSYGTLIGQDAGVSFLIIMLSLKLLEIRRQRDVMLFIYMGYFLVITNFLFTQSIFMAVYMFIVCICLTSTMIIINKHEAQLKLRDNLKTASALVIQAIPFMLVLFVLFPRLTSPIWAVPSSSKQGISGLSDEMSPGSISKLSKSDEVAFRVDFKKSQPQVASLYWRGPVLAHYDGKTWKQIKSPTKQTLGQISHQGNQLDYTITLEPHYQQWLFGLDMPGSIPAKAYLNDGFSLLSRKKIDKVQQYSISSFTQYQFGTNLNDKQRVDALRLPAELNPQTRNWVKQITNQHKAPENIINQVLSTFRNQAFHYTLEPDLLGKHAVDDFMFKTRRGFCEHYASSFVYIMRLAGIPARVVVGYQGGQYNELGDYLIVRQSDAHAWAEVWLKNRGWVRYDPTSAVSPARIETGIDAALPEREAMQGLFSRSNPLFRTVRLYWDSLNYSWHKWVLGYNSSVQSSLLKRLGISASDWQDIAISVLVSIGGMLIIATLWISLNKRRKTHDPALKVYQTFCRKLANIGYNREAYEGPQDFCRRIIGERSDLEQDIIRITSRYIQIRYGRNPPARLYEEFNQAVRQFKPKYLDS